MQEENKPDKSNELKWNPAAWFAANFGAVLWQGIIIPLFLRNDYLASAYVTIASIIIIAVSAVVIFLKKSRFDFFSAVKIMLSIITICYLAAALAINHDKSFYLLNMNDMSLWIIPLVPIILKYIFIYRFKPREEKQEQENHENQSDNNIMP